jgi:methyl-accepting chemotaxis protein
MIARNHIKETITINRFFEEIYTRSNKLIEYFLCGYFLFGLLIAGFYDTWFVASIVGGICLALYFISKMLFPRTTVNQYVASGVLAIYMAQFIYQMHGLFEMHFFAFIGATLLITYQNWKNLIPLAALIIMHHALFGFLQYRGFDQVFFTELQYMSLQTFIIHATLATVIILICGLWAYELNKTTIKNTRNILLMEEMSESISRNIEFAHSLANRNLNTSFTPEEGDILGEALLDIQKILVKSEKV